MVTWTEKKKITGVNKAKRLRNLFSYVVLFAALLAMTFFGVCSPQQRTLFNLGGGAAKVDGYEIDYNDFKRAYEQSLEYYKKLYPDNFDPAAIKLSKSVIDQLIDQRIIYILADQSGFAATDKEVEKAILQNFKDKNGKFSGDNFKRFLGYYGFTEKTYLNYNKRQLSTNKFQRTILDSLYISKKAIEDQYKIKETKINVDYIKIGKSSIKPNLDKKEVNKYLSGDGLKKVTAYYNKNKSEFNKDKKVKARHILVAYKGAKRAEKDITRTKKEALARAKKLLAEVRMKGADFAKIASKTTDEKSGKKKGGDLGYFAKEDMVKQFSDVAFKLKPGMISNIVETPFGYHIIKVEKVKPAIHKSLNQAKEQIAEKLLRQNIQPKIVQKRADELLKNLKDKKSINNMLKKYKLSWKSTGDFALTSKYIPNIGMEDNVVNAVYSLKNPKDLYTKVLDVKGDKYIIKLKSIKIPKKPTKEEETKLSNELKYSLYKTEFSLIKDVKKKQLKENGDIWVNEKYLNIDNRNKA